MWIVGRWRLSHFGTPAKDRQTGTQQRTDCQMKRQNSPQAGTWRHLLPNAITCAALACGVTAIRFGIDGEFRTAVMAIILAMMLDALDGRVARAVDGESPFGAELDSLADLINFGVAPGVLIWLSSLHALGNLGWIAIIFFAIACCVRLARFNVATTDPDEAAWKANYFSGVNAPAGAALSMVPLYLGFSGLVPGGADIAGYVALYMAAIAALMVSRIPTYSFKNVRLSKPVKLVLALGFLVLLPSLFLHTWQLLLVGCCIYILLIPFSIINYRQDKARLPGDDNEQVDPDSAVILPTSRLP